MSKTVTLRLEDDVYYIFTECAKAVRRSLANFIETAALENARRSSFVEDEEMTGILADKALVRRLRHGSRDARHRKGRFVD